MKRRETSLILVVIHAVALLNSPVSAKYGGGQGTADDPYLIYTAEDLKALSEDRDSWGNDGYYELMADIDLSVLEEPWQPIGDSEVSFAGTFHGNGKTISNLRIRDISGDYVGLFGRAWIDVYDLRLLSVDVNAPASSYVGALAGWTGLCQVDRCCVEGGQVLGQERVGGLIGDSYGVVNQCFTTCQVTGSVKVGGLLGVHNQNHAVSQCYSTSSVSGNDSVGGLVAINRGVLRDSYAAGEVHGSTCVGGLVGDDESKGLIWNCYAVGPVTSNGASSGLCGSDVPCYRSFWDIESTGHPSSRGGVGKTSAEMRTAATFAGWGRSGAWTIDEGIDYPKLAWEGCQGIPLTTPAFPGTAGSGTADDPYLIYTAEQFNAIGDCPGEWDRYYRLESDLDLADLNEPFRMIGHDEVRFTGTLDGAEHSIANLTCSYDNYRVGMFACTQGATIKRVILVDPKVEQKRSVLVGALVGQQVEGIVEACGVEGGRVAAMDSVGGLVGYCYAGTISRSYSNCSVEGQNRAEAIGGLVGLTAKCSINNCCAFGSVSGLHSVGGLIGEAREGGTVSHCYAVGSVACPQDPWSVPDAGGLIGTVGGGTSVTSCFWNTETSGFAISAGGTGATTVQMQQAATFIEAGWDFVGERANGMADIWRIDPEGASYPTFAPPGEFPLGSAWSDDFEDGLTATSWQVYEPSPMAVRLEETNGRLEVVAPIETFGAQALYVSQDWLLDTARDFFISVDFHFAGSDIGEGYVLLGLTPEPNSPLSQRVEVAAGSIEGEPVFMARQSVGGWRQAWWADRPSDFGKLYISYDAEADALYLGLTGHGPVNAWRTLTGVVNGQWAGRPLCLYIGGRVEGMILDGSEAWLDNIVVDSPPEDE